MTDSRIARIEDKIDHVVERLSSIDSTLSAQHVSLKEHIRRTDLLESQVKPIEKHVTMVHGAIKLVGLVALLAGIAEGSLAAIELLRKVVR